MPDIKQSVLIEAPIDHVYAVARNSEAFPQFMADLQSLTIKERSEDGNRIVSEWVGLIREFKMTVKWTQVDVWEPSTYRDEFKMLQGDMDRMEGYWQFMAVGEKQTSFESVMSYDYNVPLIGPMVKNLIKKKMTDNLQATMDAIKSQSEMA